jgi:hypothetical protein
VSAGAIEPEWAEHNTTGLDCWCDPVFYAKCDECGVFAQSPEFLTPGMIAERRAKARDCWKCDRGLIQIDREEVDEDDMGSLVIVHHNRDGDEIEVN